MKLIDDLRAEHDLIERVVGSFRTYVEARLRGEGVAADGRSYVRFFRHFAGDFHHAKEEDTLFPALQAMADLPRSGPIEVLTEDHRRLGAVLAEIGTLLGRDVLDVPDVARLKELAVEYSHGLWHHIDAENSVLLPESEGRLAKKGVRELPSREMSSVEAAARDAAGDLLRRYPPTHDPSIIRGDGCVSCRAFAGPCRGLEHEWWNEWEWEEFEDRVSGE